MHSKNKGSQPAALLKAGQTNSLGELRAQIDALDLRLVNLLNQRAAFSLQVGELKKEENSSVFRPEREQEILNKLSTYSSGVLPSEHLQAIYKEIFSSSRALQRPQRLAYLGPEGTFSHTAGLRLLGSSLDYLPQKSIPDVFKTVIDGDCDYGLVPVENSLQGTVGACIDSFLLYPAVIIAEMFSRIRHSIFSAENKLDTVEVVYSHPQALSQCSIWLNQHLPEAAIVPVESSAAAAKRVLHTPNSAAIGQPALKKIFQLYELQANIGDFPDNWTRFFLISKSGHNTPASLPEQSVINKSSLLFTVQDKPGSLVIVLNLLAKNGINLTKLESRPQPHKRWDYIFFADLDCALNEQEHPTLLDKLNEVCPFCRLLGKYATGPYLDSITE